MPIPVRCVHCGAKLNARDIDAGKTKGCPKCGKPVKVPAAGGYAASPATPPAPRKPAAAPPASDHPKPAAAQRAEELPALPEPPDEEPAPVAAAENAPFYGADQPRSSPLKWALALILFVLGVGFCAYILTRDRNADGQGEQSTGVRVDDNIVKQNRALAEKATEAAKAGNKEDAIKLYRQLVANLEKLPRGLAPGLQRIRLELKSLETGRSVADLAAEEEGKTPPPGAPQQPGATPGTVNAPPVNPPASTEAPGAAQPATDAPPRADERTAAPPAADPATTDAAPDGKAPAPDKPE